MSIDWDKIWKYHAPNYRDGYAHITLSEGLSFQMRPGPGFGEGAHPTTRLMLSLMPGLVKGKVVADVGSGTGILSIASALMGAKQVYAFEIDEGAIAHSKENFRLNNVSVSMNAPPPSCDLVLINMISSEQRTALSQYPFLKPRHILVSGLLAEEEHSYLKEHADWTCLSKSSDQGWMAIFFLAST